MRTYSERIQEIGKKQLKRLTTIFGALLLLLGQASAETSPLEEEFRKLLQERPGFSVVFMDVRLLKEGSIAPCYQMKVTLASDAGKLAFLQTHLGPGLFGSTALDGDAVLLRPGTYTVEQLECQAGTKLKLNGRFARFRVQQDAIINVGCLVLDYKPSAFNLLGPNTFSGRTSVEDMSSKTRESLSKRAPNVFAKATKRYMIPNPKTSN